MSPERAATLALYHDASEVLTGDLPVARQVLQPGDPDAPTSAIETAASNEKLFELIPDALKAGYEAFFRRTAGDRAHRDLVQGGRQALRLRQVPRGDRGGQSRVRPGREGAAGERGGVWTLPEVRYFLETFVPSFRLTLDELN